MVYTITFNPALDYSVVVNNLKNGATNRADSESIMPGGKGLNVSAVLSELGTDNIALGFVAGFTGDEIERRFNMMGYRSDFIRLNSGMSRINIKIKSDTETEINASGPDVDEKSLGDLVAKLKNIKSGDVVIFAGSKPRDLSDMLYADIISELSDKGALFIVDATGDLLINSLRYNPFLIKPNNFELGEVFGVEIKSCDDAVIYARKLQDMGAVNVLVSMGSKGAVLLTDNGDVLKCPAPDGEVINSVGAGDSMIAGFVSGYLRNGDYNYALKLGVAAGSASAFSDTLADNAAIYDIYKEL